jgi:hypothetical protein
MRYLLAVGFCCDVFRKEPRTRIFIDDHLIDEFDVKNYQITRVINDVELYKKLQPSPLEYSNIEIDMVQSLLKFYEIELNEKQEKLNLCIHVDNDDSNFNNGFMNRSTLLRLACFYIVPLNKKISIKLIKIFKKKITKKTYAWYRRRHSGMYNLLPYTTWYGKNNQKYSDLKKTRFNIGGSGYFSCDLIKKYKIFMPTIYKPYRFSINQTLYNYIFDKYKQYADQRSTD